MEIIVDGGYRGVEGLWSTCGSRVDHGMIAPGEGLRSKGWGRKGRGLKRGLCYAAAAAAFCSAPAIDLALKPRALVRKREVLGAGVNQDCCATTDVSGVLAVFIEAGEGLP